MPVYAVAQITIHDRERYQRYASRFMEVLIRHDGRLLAADEQADVVEGRWDHDKIIIMSFKDRAAFDAWAHSPEYQEISRDRVAATDGVVLVVSGVG
ncbi:MULTISPECIES: DUF1330 domain-containing protein [Streptomyces]|uniref:DUF1330 domain-containing protein n=1 Tax=Streptomyces TaxID=1883 RepID=UPI00292FC29C|nr:DUF1330 domain-containing protein [Streptomyces sp. NEAU-HV9]